MKALAVQCEHGQITQYGPYRTDTQKAYVEQSFITKPGDRIIDTNTYAARNRIQHCHKCDTK